MPRSLTAIVLLLGLTGLSAVQAQSWTQVADYPGVARDDGAAFAIGGVAYCGTGIASSFAVLGDFYAFDMTTEQWGSIAPMPAQSARQYAVGFSHGSFGYIFGGVNSTTFLNDLWRYDPQTDTWLELSPLPGTGRSGAMGFVMGDTAYIVGGKTAGLQAIDDVWAYHIPTDTWEEKGPMPFGARWRAGAAVIDGVGYILGGMDEAPAFQAGFYGYDANADTWSTLPAFPGSDRNYMALQSIGTELVAFGGFDATETFHNDLWTYQLATETWVERNPLPVDGRRGGMHFTDGNSFYYAAGLFSNFERTKEMWKASDVLSTKIAEANSEVELFPNPTLGQLTLRIDDLSGCGEIEVDVIDPFGRILMESQNAHAKELHFSLGSLPDGPYFIRVQNACYSVSRRVIKI